MLDQVSFIFNSIDLIHFIFRTVTQQGFDGCIKDVQLGSAVRDINDNTYALGVLPGCPEVFHKRASTTAILKSVSPCHRF